MAFAALSEDWGIAKSDKLAAFSEHPDTLFPGFLSYFAGMVHICEYYRGILPKVMGSAGVMWHLRDGDVSKDTISPHLFHESIRTSDVLLVVGGSDVSELCPYPISGCYDGPNLEVFQEDVLELDYLFMGNGSCRGEVEVPVSLLVAFLIEFRDPPSAVQNNGVFCELFDFCAGC
jgi:hypothetical protein